MNSIRKDRNMARKSTSALLGLLLEQKMKDLKGGAFFDCPSNILLKQASIPRMGMGL